ncbi:hypothetical protein J6590_105442 [Homalodisca vitripennis]|nr:hypothetical protein J6590_105442 [Homalodisca vitripennis]
MQGRILAYEGGTRAGWQDCNRNNKLFTAWHPSCLRSTREPEGLRGVETGTRTEARETARASEAAWLFMFYPAVREAQQPRGRGSCCAHSLMDKQVDTTLDMTMIMTAVTSSPLPYNLGQPSAC